MYNKISQHNEFVAVATFVQNFGSQTFLWECKGGFQIDFLLENRVSATCIYRKTDFETIGGYDENMKRGFEDWFTNPMPN